MLNSKLKEETMDFKQLRFDSVDFIEERELSWTYYNQNYFPSDKIDSEEIEVGRSSSIVQLAKTVNSSSPFLIVSKKTNKNKDKKRHKNNKLVAKKVLL